MESIIFIGPVPCCSSHRPSALQFLTSSCDAPDLPPKKHLPGDSFPAAASTAGRNLLKLKTAGLSSEILDRLPGHGNSDADDHLRQLIASGPFTYQAFNSFQKGE